MCSRGILLAFRISLPTDPDWAFLTKWQIFAVGKLFEPIPFRYVFDLLSG